MKNKIYLYNTLLVILSLLFVIGCESESKETQATGYIQLGVEKNEILYTRAGEPVTDEVLGVYFINAQGDTIKQFENYKEEVEGQRILLPVGAYDVVVNSADVNEPLWDIPAYYGDTTLTIKAGEISAAAIECKITNTKATVEFTTNVAKYFSYYEAVVKGKSGELTFVMDEERAGFYSTDKFTVTLNLVNKNNGLSFQFVKVFPDILARYHYKLKFDTDDSGDDNAGGNIDIKIDEELEEVNCTIKIPGYTQLMDIPKAPVVAVQTQLTGKELTNIQDLVVKKVEGEPIVEKHQLSFTTVAGLRNLYVRLSDVFVKEDNFPEIFDWLDDSNASLRNKLKVSSGYDASGSIYTLDMKDMVNNYLTPYEKSSKTYELQIIALDVYQQEISTTLSYTVSPDLDLMTEEPEVVWATFAVLKGGIDPVGGSGAKFLYGKSSESESSWNEIAVTSNDYGSDGNIEKLVTGLEPGTEYSFKLTGYLNNDYMEGDVFSFRTELTPTIPNLNFDDWYQANPNNAWYPGVSSDNIYWDSGNEGANTASTVNPTAQEATDVVSGNAARLTSKTAALGIFAAGNIYTGKFVKVAISLSGSGAELDFGIEYAGRPTKLTGYYKYNPENIDKADSNHDHLKNKQDTCAIYIALFDEQWNGPFRVNTSKGTFVDFTVDNCIAYGSLTEEEAGRSNMSEYVKFEIDIEYRKLNVQPKYALIVASASKYGDYFTGGVGSTLLIDEFELSFDYNAASFKGTNSILENK